MKKLCLLLALALLLTGCGKAPAQTDDNSETGWVSFDVFAVNDLHGKLEDSDDQPGVDELSTYLENNGNAILLSTGDMWQGASESNLTKGFIITEWMNKMNFTAMTVGGHEFDWGEEWLQRNIDLAEFPFLGINVFSRETNQRVDYCQSSLVVEMDGVQIGIIGAIGDCYSSISPEFSQNFYFQTGEDLTALVKAESEKLRSEGVDFVIYTIHDGYDKNTSDTQARSVNRRDLRGYYDTSLSDGYVDLVFEADTHHWYVLVDEYGVYHLQGGSNNDGVSHARVMINKADGSSTVLTAELVPELEYRYLNDHPVVDELMEQYSDQIAPAFEVLGTNSRYRGGSDICQLVADLYCEAGVQKWGEQYDIVLGGGYMSCRSPGYLDDGQVVYSQLQAILPFDNKLTLCSIRGSDLIKRFLETTHEAYYIKTTEYGESIRGSIDPNGTYYLITDTYSAYYSYNNLTVIEIYDEVTFARDLVAEYIKQGGLS